MGGYGYSGYGGYYGKRSAEAEAKPYYGYGGYGLGLGYGYAAAPVVEPKDSGLIFTPSSGAIPPAFTDAQKEANPEIAEGSDSIKVPVVTGVHLIGKREAEPYYYGGLGYGYGLGYYGYGKRSAEAEAKPYYGLGYGVYGYGGLCAYCG